MNSKWFPLPVTLLLPSRSNYAWDVVSECKRCFPTSRLVVAVVVVAFAVVVVVAVAIVVDDEDKGNVVRAEYRFENFCASTLTLTNNPFIIN